MRWLHYFHPENALRSTSRRLQGFLLGTAVTAAAIAFGIDFHLGSFTFIVTFSALGSGLLIGLGWRIFH